MNRTSLVLLSAAVLAVVALVSPPKKEPVAPRAWAPDLAPAALGRAAVATAGPLTMTARLSSARVLAGKSTVHAHVDVSASAAALEAPRVPVNLAVAIDNSGSMQGQKLEQARTAALNLLGQLREGDRLAVVVFSDEAHVHPSTAITPDSLVELRHFISGISEAGGTNIGAGLISSYAEVRRYAHDYKVSRVILLSDGQPTAGETSPTALVSFAAHPREERISTSAFGIGLDFNDVLMRDIATAGGGGYAFVEDASTLWRQFARELKDASQNLARQVRLQVVPAEGVVVEEVAGHAFRRLPNGGVEVALYDFGPGQTSQLLVRLTVNAPEKGMIDLGTASVSCTDVQKDVAASASARFFAEATASAAEVTLASDPAVTEMVKRVDIGRRVDGAKAAYASGNTALAIDMMASVRQMFGASADALAGTPKEIEDSWREGGEAARRANMTLTNKTMRTFGENNAY